MHIWWMQLSFQGMFSLFKALEKRIRGILVEIETDVIEPLLPVNTQVQDIRMSSAIEQDSDDLDSADGIDF